MLQDMGIPIEGTRGPTGGYRVRPGYKLPPLMLSDDEAVAVCLGLQALPRTGLVAAPEVVAGATAKIERVLPESLRRRVQALQAGIAVEAPAGPAAPAATIAALTEAAKAGRRVWLRYGSQRGEETERAVDPYGVACWSRHWYVAGYCHLRADLRTFRLDRVLAVKPCDETFTPPPDFDALTHVIRSIATMPGMWTVEVLFHADLDAVGAQVPAAFGQLEAAPEGTVFRCHYDDLDGLARWLGLLGLPFAVRRPPELGEALRRLAIALVAGAAGGGSAGTAPHSGPQNR
jgi:predicted DNA-binding transcriptional regulator YafY